MRILIIIAIVISNFLIQSTILQYFSILGIVPNTALIIVISFALIRGKRTGAIIGLTVGLLHDIMFCDVIGVHALIYFLLGYTLGLIDQKIFRENVVIPFFLTGLATIAFHSMYYVFMYFLSANVHFLSVVRSYFIVEPIYNAVLTIPIYINILKIYREHTISFRRK